MKKLLEVAKQLHDGHRSFEFNHESVTCPLCQFHVHLSMDSKCLVQHWGTKLFVRKITTEKQLSEPIPQDAPSKW